MAQDTVLAGGQQRGFSASVVAAFEKYMPETFSLSIILTVIVVAAAMIFAPKHTFDDIETSWFTGVFGILAFAFQMVLILVTGYAIAESPPVQKLLKKVASNATTPANAVLITFPIVAGAAWLNWAVEKCSTRIPTIPSRTTA